MILSNFRFRKEIRRLKRMIVRLEKKRARSQAALVNAILLRTSPSDSDTDYFNRYTNQITSLRERIRLVESRMNTKVKQ